MCKNLTFFPEMCTNINKGNRSGKYLDSKAVFINKLLFANTW